MWRVEPEEITAGPIARVLAITAAPLVAQNLVHVANVVVDTFWLGRLGETEVAAVGLNLPLVSVVAAAVVLVSIGTQITLAHRVGADDRRGARRTGATGLALAAVLGVAVCGGVAANAGPLMGLLAGDTPVARLGAVYLATLMAFYPFAFASDTVENAFVGWGDTSAALYINVANVAVNVVLDPVLIFGWGPVPALGVQGAAVASGLGIVVGFAMGLGFALGLRESFTFDRGRLRPSAALLREIVGVGTPLAGQRLARDVVRVAIIGIVAAVAGAAGLAAFSVGARVATLAFIPALGLQQAAQAIVGQNLGANRPDRALRATAVGVAMAGGGLAVLGGIQWFVPGLIVDVLVPDLTPRGRELTVVYLRILALSYWALGVTYLLLAGFNGAKRTGTSFVVDVVKYWGVRLPIALLALPTTATVGLAVVVRPGIDLGVEAIFWAVTVSNVVTVPVLGAYFLYTTRRGMFERAAEAAAEAAGG